MSTAETSVRVLQGGEMDFIAEARAIQHAARATQERASPARVVTLGQIVFFSTSTGDAWMLDPRDGGAACLARDGDPLPIPIRESATDLAIEWHADYRIEGRAFTVVDRDSGSARTILGYPVAEIERVLRGVAVDRASDSPLPAARERLKSGRNDPCPCGSGRKYKKCCLRSDEELVRQTKARGQTEAIRHVEPAAPAEGAIDEEADDRSESKLPPEVRSRLDALWQAFDAVSEPTVAQMDELLGELLALPPEATDWDELLHRFARHKHPDLHAVFRRIAAEVPHNKESGMAFFYWAAAEEFAGGNLSALLPEVADGFCRLDGRSYNADALAHIGDHVLAGHFEDEALRLTEHFLPVERKDDELTSWAVPNTCSLIFQLRVGIALRRWPHESPQAVAQALGRGIEKDLDDGVIPHAARAICESDSRSAWTRAHFALRTSDIRTSDQAWQECLRLYGTLIDVAQDAWRRESFPPGCAFVGLSRLLESIDHARVEAGKQRGKKRKRQAENLLDYLNPGGMEARLARSCRGMLGVNVPRARILLDAYEVLLRFAVRHQLVAAASAAATHMELARLRGVIEAVR